MSIKKSIIQEAVLQSNDLARTVDITEGILAIEYFEDVFSPTITAKIKVVNAGNTIASAENSQVKQSIYNGLPLRGGERLALKIAGNSTTNKDIDFSTKVKDYLYVSSITDVLSETQNESFTLHLVSREAITNETTRVMRKYPTSLRISESVRKILTDVLQTDKIGSIDDTSNQYGFIGNMRKPFTVLIWLASKGVPVKSGDSTAGFLFYQTQDGFQFRSLDDLIAQSPKATYTYSGANVNYDEEQKKVNNDFNILNYATEKNQNLIEKLRLGTYSSQRMFFNPLDFSFSKYEEGIFQLKDYVSNIENLGKDLKLPLVAEGQELTLGDVPTRIITGIFDVGTMENGVDRTVNADQTKYQSQSLMRYNIMFTQTMNIMIPLNTNLRAGDLIKCQFPRITKSDQRDYDPEISDLYMIKELCHHFDTTNSYTSLKLIRDTFGLKKQKNDR
jgi:hypothetical protein